MFEKKKKKAQQKAKAVQDSFESMADYIEEEDLPEKVEEATEAVEEAAEEVVEETEEVVEEAAEEVAEEAEDRTEEVEDAVDDANLSRKARKELEKAEKAEEKAQEEVEKAEAKVEKAEAEAQEKADEAAEKADAVAEKAEKYADAPYDLKKEKVDKAQEKADKAQEKADEAQAEVEAAQAEVEEARAKAERAAANAAKVAADPEKAAKKSRRKTRWTAIGIIVLLIALIAAGTIFYMRSHVMLVSPGKRMPYFKSDLLCYGYNGYGSVNDESEGIDEPLANQIIDYEKLYADVFGLSLSEVQDSKMFQTETENHEFKDKTARTFANCFTCTAVDGTGLSNGDTVTINISVDAKTINKMDGVKKKLNAGDTSKSYLVTGLADPAIVIDPFNAVRGVYQTDDGETSIDLNPTYRETFGDYTIYNPTLHKMSTTAKFRIRDEEKTICGDFDFTADWTKDYVIGNKIKVTVYNAATNAPETTPEANYVILDNGVVLAPATQTFNVMDCAIMKSGKSVTNVDDLCSTADTYALYHFGKNFNLVDIWAACPKSGNELKKSDAKNYVFCLFQYGSSDFRAIIFENAKVDAYGNIVDIGHTAVIFEGEDTRFYTRQTYIRNLQTSYGDNYAFTKLSKMIP